MNEAIARVAEAIALSGFGDWASGSSIAYPLANVLHLLGLVMLVGGIGIVDLRLAGAFRAIPAEALSRALTPVAIAGLTLMLPSGATMFAADTAVAASPIFRLKLALIAVALINAVAFRRVWRGRFADWDNAPPLLGRAMALGSIFLWLAVATAGRMIAYS